MSHISVSGFRQEDWGLEFSLEVGIQDPLRLASLDFESDSEYYASQLVNYLEEGLPGQDLVTVVEDRVVLKGYNCSKEYFFDELVDTSCSETLIESLHELLSGL